MKPVSNPASALGEAVGKLIERSLIESVQQEVLARDFVIESGRLKNGSENTYQIDAVIFDQSNRPVILIESKYIRYKKHNRDKASWLCVAHHNLRKTFPTIRRSIAVLAGNWSTPSKALLDSFGVEVIELPFGEIVRTLAGYDICFEWEEKDRETPQKSWETYCNLDPRSLQQIAGQLIEPVRDQLVSSIVETLDTDLSDIRQHVSEVEVLLKTNRGEMVLRSYESVAASLQDLMSLVQDKPHQTDELS